jgi:hypothetical protein
MLKFALFLALGVTTSWGSIIDAGDVFTTANFVPDGTKVQFSLSSSDGKFSLFQLGSGVFGGADLDCPLGVDFCPYGQTYTITAFFPDASSVPAEAMAIIDGNAIGSVLIGCPNPACPQTSVVLTAQAVDISSPGLYVIPFSATGQIQAAQNCVPQNAPCSLILDQTISGAGFLTFSVITSSPGFFGVRNPVPDAFAPLRWEFEPVPEPSTILPVLFGLAAIQRRRHLRK